MIIDFHVHVIKDDGNISTSLKELMEKAYPGYWQEYLSRYTTAEQIVNMLDNAGVNYAVLLAEICPEVTCVITNEEVSQLCRQSPRLIPFANINPHFVNDMVRTLEYCVDDLGCRGVKLLPSYQNWHPLEPRMYKLYDAAQEMEIPLLFHTGSSVFAGTRLKYADPLLLDDIAVDFPRLTLI
ncbi:MAG TPA: metal-dependent hydrolase, partial [Desulfotomaculum sp.]|nr:metal-dependent hydrolase [Desulfotomaculum sp.]